MTVHDPLQAEREVKDSQQPDDAIVDLYQLATTCETPSGPFTVLHNINLRIQMGEFIAAVGRSGSAKTILFNVLAGIDRPTSGTISVDGTRVDSLSESQLAEWRGRASPGKN